MRGGGSLPSKRPRGCRLALAHDRLLRYISNRDSGLSCTFGTLGGVASSGGIFRSGSNRHVCTNLLSCISRRPSRRACAINIAPMLLPCFAGLSSRFAIFSVCVRVDFGDICSRHFCRFYYRCHGGRSGVFFVAIRSVGGVFGLLRVGSRGNGVVRGRRCGGNSSFGGQILSGTGGSVEGLCRGKLYSIYFSCGIGDGGSENTIATCCFVVRAGNGATELNTGGPIAPARVGVLSRNCNTGLAGVVARVGAFLHTRFEIRRSGCCVATVDGSISAISSRSREVRVLRGVTGRLGGVTLECDGSSFSAGREGVYNSMYGVLCRSCKIPCVGKGPNGKMRNELFSSWCVEL